MVVKPIKLEDLITRLEASNARELWVDIDEIEPGVYKLPLSAIGALLARSDGTVKAADGKHYMWPGGTLTSYKMKCINDGSNAGNQTVKIEPAVNSPVFLHRMAIEHNDVSDRVQQARILSSGGVTPEWALVYQATQAASTPTIWPTSTAPVTVVSLIHPDFELVVIIEALAVTKIGTFFLQYSYIGDPPTITETGPTGSAFTMVS